MAPTTERSCDMTMNALMNSKAIATEKSLMSLRASLSSRLTSEKPASDCSSSATPKMRSLKVLGFFSLTASSGTSALCRRAANTLKERWKLAGTNEGRQRGSGRDRVRAASIPVTGSERTKKVPNSGLEGTRTINDRAIKIM
ncbi:hypothetical protein OGATHE_001144 [Ogataea polymorpha]|uniref:Uncharacterized protein n=1 Tax=Ogataea polymorpha TaxID=460523 RepID=A0A9P8TFG3_9ASCO|nr:hypothetical protein OGATHE_001144 [Ogataea polymorpha]